MILYHGTNVNIDVIDLSKCRPYKDFGRGFYLTSMKDQAEKMAIRVSGIYGGPKVVNMFEFNETAYTDKQLNIKQFDIPNETWADFILNNRNKEFTDLRNQNSNLDNKYDIVIGPVANDDLALLFRQFARNLITMDILVNEMKYKKLTNQYSFHTDAALKYLKKVGEING